MAGTPVEVELEAIYKSRIKQVQKMIKSLNQLENETDDTNGISAKLDLYTRQLELRTYITNYRIVLSQLKRYGKYYTGNPIKGSWLIGLTNVEKTVFVARFRENQSFEKISEKFKIPDSHKVYGTAYKKVMVTIQQQKTLS